MSDLTNTARCKVCGQHVVLIKPTPIIGQDQTAAELAAGFQAITKHMAEKHKKEIYPVSQLWQATFGEYFFLSLYELPEGVLSESHTYKRLCLSSVAPSADGDSVLSAAFAERGMPVPDSFIRKENAIVT